MKHYAAGSGSKKFIQILMKAREKRENGFKCSHCSGSVPFSEFIGTEHRNHCPFCLWSKHVDLEKSGDRKSKCQAAMSAVGLTFKKEGRDKYGQARQGEIMIIHRCTRCGKVSINRIAGDDNAQAILDLFEESKKLSPQEVKDLNKDGIQILTEKDRQEINTQLFGKNLGKSKN
jgi:DNA-directed RNA polymerase subunit RPC12/RpoP